MQNRGLHAFKPVKTLKFGVSQVTLKVIFCSKYEWYTDKPRRIRGLLCFYNYQAYLLQKTSIFEPVAKAITIQGVFVSMQLNMSHFKIFGFASSSNMW